MIKLKGKIYMQKLIDLIKRLYKQYKSIILYVFFGGLTTLVNYAVYFPCRFLGISLIVSSVIAWICAVLFAFFTNRKWVFNSPAKDTKDFFRQITSFFGSRIFSFFLETAILWFFVEIVHFNELIMKILASIITVILNYVLSKLIVFRKKEQADK